jgi:glutaredoxin 3
MKQVLIYSTPNCIYCKMAKEFFTANNVAYTEFNVAADPAKKEELLAKSGQLGVPVIQIGDDSIVIGFNKPKIKELLGLQ